MWPNPGAGWLCWRDCVRSEPPGALWPCRDVRRHGGTGGTGGLRCAAPAARCADAALGAVSARTRMDGGAATGGSGRRAKAFARHCARSRRPVGAHGIHAVGSHRGAPGLVRTATRAATGARLARCRQRRACAERPATGLVAGDGCARGPGAGLAPGRVAADAGTELRRAHDRIHTRGGARAHRIDPARRWLCRAGSCRRRRPRFRHAMSGIYLPSPGLVCALGHGIRHVRQALWDAAGPAGLTHTERYSPGRSLPVGEIQAALPSLAHVAPEFRIRNNAIALLALAEMRPAVDAAIGRFGSDRVAIVVGTSTSGLPEGEAARRTLERTGSWPRGFSYAQQELGNLADFLAVELGVTGVAHVISTACSSGAKSLASGARLLNAAMADAVVAGGCDAVGAFTVAGFSALEAVSAARCNPMSVNRRGINLGEGAAFFLMTREPGPVRLAGGGESADAHHMSTPDPTGRGAMRAMQSALQRAGVPAGAVDYINLHGTATHYNDAMESLAVAQVLGTDVPASSTKPLTGHTLAAAGAIEAAFGWLTLVDNPRGVLPPHWWDGQPDPALAPLRLVAPNDSLGRAPRYMLSNSFAFGGSNASVLLGCA